MKPSVEPKIVKLYKQLFDEGKVELINLDEFFLLRPNTSHLGNLLDGYTPEEFQAKQAVTQAIVSGVLRVFEAEQGLKLFNACQTLGVIAYHVGKNVENMAHATCSQNVTDSSASETSAYVNATVFSLLLSFASFTFTHFEKVEQREQSKLCLKILWHIAPEPYVQSAMQDIHLATAVALYKAPMRHRPASYEPVMPTPYTLSTALLELLTDFNSTHLMVQFPFAHYHYSLSILHLILIYHKKCRIRLKSWRPLFNSLVSLINFLTQTAPKVQPSSGVFRLVARVLLVLNFFITYGDTFLPDAAAYDSLYYEISRQDSIFLKLAALIEEACI